MKGQGASGRTIAHYKIIEEIGSGSTGVLYRAQDVRLGRHVALKLLKGGRTNRRRGDEEGLIRGLLREAQMASRIAHPNVCTIYDVGTDPAFPYIAMELVEGMTLRKMIRDERTSGTLLSLPLLFDYGLQIAGALDAAHRNNVLHRDIKAENVMVDTEGSVRVMDFGLARLDAGERMSVNRSLIGTIGYMAPEVLRGEDPDHRSDTFSLGVLLFELATGVLPFAGAHESALMYATLHEEPRPLDELRDDLPPALATLILEALSKDPADRPPSVRDIYDRLRTEGVAQGAVGTAGVRRHEEEEGSGERRSLRSVGTTSLRNWYLPESLRRREIRLFLCSAANDLSEERDYLIRRVFPEIRAACRRLGVRFTEVDLRWESGSTNLDGARALRASLSEIDRCRPYFLGLLGRKYGEVLDPLRIVRDPAISIDYPWIEEAVLDGMSLLDMEMSYGLLQNEGPTGRGLVYQRSEREEGSASGSSVESTGSADRLEGLKRRLAADGVPIQDFRDPAALGALVYNDLLERINRDVGHLAPQTPLQRERSLHAAFAMSRRRAYIPRPASLRALNHHVDSEAPPLLVAAAPGRGKSSLLAYWGRGFRRRHPEVLLVEHYAGVSEGSVGIAAVIRHLCEEIADMGDSSEEIPTDPNQLRRALRRWFGYAAETLERREERMVLLIDGIDQAGPEGIGLDWLPKKIDPRIRIVLSSNAEETVRSVDERGWQRIDIEEFDRSEREALIARYLGEFHREIDAEQIAPIIKAPQAAHPLYLRTLLEEIRILSAPREIPRRIRELLGADDVEALFGLVLDRIEDDFSRRSVRSFLSALHVSTSGLDETEVSEITGLSRLTITSLVAGLDYHIVYRAGRLFFFHESLRHAVERRYLESEEERRETRLQVGDYFAGSEPNRRNALEALRAYALLGKTGRTTRFLARMEILLLIYDNGTHHNVRSAWSALLQEDVDIEEIYRQSIEEYRRGGATQMEVLDGLYTIAHLLETMNRWEGVREFTAQLLAVATEIGEDRLLCKGETMLGLIDWRTGENESALIHYREAKRAATRAGEKTLLATVLKNMGDLHFARGEYDLADVTSSEAMKLYDELGDEEGVADALYIQGLLLGEQGSRQEQMEVYERALAIYRKSGHRQAEAVLLTAIGNAHYNRGRYPEALEAYDIARVIQQEAGNRRSVGLLIAAAANVDMVCGRYSEAREGYERALKIHRDLREKPKIAVTLNYIANVYSSEGRLDRAIACQEEAIALYREMNDRSGEALVTGDIGVTYIKLGEQEKAIEALESALQMHRDLGEKKMEARVMGNLGSFYSEIDVERSLDYLFGSLEFHREREQAYDVLCWTEQIGMTILGLSRTEEEVPPYLPKFLQRSGYLTEPSEEWRQDARSVARHLFDEGERIAREIGAAENLERIVGWKGELGG